MTTGKKTQYEYEGCVPRRSPKADMLGIAIYQLLGIVGDALDDQEKVMVLVGVAGSLAAMAPGDIDDEILEAISAQFSLSRDMARAELKKMRGEQN